MDRRPTDTLRLNDRRRHPRLTIARPCKVAQQGATRFAFARTRNISESGALLEMDFERPIAAGDTLALAVAWADEPLLTSNSLREAKVIRTTPVGDRRHIVAVEFRRAALAHAA